MPDLQTQTLKYLTRAQRDVVANRAQGDSRLLLADLGEMQVDHDGFERTVAEVGGNLAHRGSTFEHVGGEAVTQGVDAKLEVGAIQPALGFGDLQGSPDRDLGHVVRAAGKGPTQGEPGTFPSATGAREEPLLIAMRQPETAQPIP